MELIDYIYISMGMFIVGLFIYGWGIRKNYFYTTNQISWILFPSLPILIIFSAIPTENQISGNILGLSVSGAIGAFFFIWLYGSKNSLKAVEIDRCQQEKKLLQDKLNEMQPSKIVPNQYIYKYKVKNSDKYINLITGNIKNIKVIDIWVNSENTNMQMASFYDKSISGIIRYLGAKRSDGIIIEDTIAEELKKKMGNRNSIDIANVLVTTSGNLENTNNVKYICHVASTYGQLGHGYKTIENIEDCLINVLQELEKEIYKDCKSILFPLLGTSSGKGELKSISQKLITVAIDYLENNPNSYIDEIYFINRRENQLNICENILNNSHLVSKVKKKI